MSTALPTSPAQLADLIREIVPFTVTKQPASVEVAGFLGHVLTLRPNGTSWTYTLGEKTGAVVNAADLGQALAELAEM